MSFLYRVGQGWRGVAFVNLNSGKVSLNAVSILYTQTPSFTFPRAELFSSLHKPLNLLSIDWMLKCVINNIHLFTNSCRHRRFPLFCFLHIIIRLGVRLISFWQLGDKGCLTAHNIVLDGPSSTHSAFGLLLLLNSPSFKKFQRKCST